MVGGEGQARQDHRGGDRHESPHSAEKEPAPIILFEQRVDRREQDAAEDEFFPAAHAQRGRLRRDRSGRGSQVSGRLEPKEIQEQHAQEDRPAQRQAFGHARC